MSKIAICLATAILFPPALAGQSATPKPAFEVASVKNSAPGAQGGKAEFLPGGRFYAVNVPLDYVIQQVYGISDYQLKGAPKWIASERYDIQAKASAQTSHPLHPVFEQVVRNAEQVRPARESVRSAPLRVRVLKRVPVASDNDKTAEAAYNPAVAIT